MEKLAIVFRYAQLYTHNCHNLCSGQSFFADHEFLGELYPTYEAAYDSVVERMLGLGQTPDLVKIQTEAASYLHGAENYWQELLTIESVIQGHVQNLIGKNLSEGTRQFVGNLADESEARMYKLKQRSNNAL